LKFIYKNSRGEISTRSMLDGWKESGAYIEGVSQGAGYRSFLKHRVVEYLEGSESLLVDPFPDPPPPVPKVRSSDAVTSEILFTGFPAVQRANLESKADAAGLKVVKSVTTRLTYLCGGPNAGPSKLAHARAQGSFILTEPGFRHLIETGEILDEESEFI